MEKVIIISNTSWSIFNFRKELINSLKQKGYEVILVSPLDDYSERLTQEMKCKWIELKMDNRGSNMIKDLFVIKYFLEIFRQEKPKFVYTFTIKPNIYAALALRMINGIKFFPTITGLGTVFIRKDWRQTIVRLLYKMALPRAQKVFFQNRDDLNFFIQNKLVINSQTVYVAGSGVDLKRFIPLQLPPKQPFVFLFVGRLIRDKGIGELLEAIKLLKNQHLEFKVYLVGFLGVQNETAITQADIDDWQKQGLVEYLGATDQVESIIAKSHVVILPSYREGLPRVLLEAAACARPVITTNVEGCRDVVLDNKTGLLCQVKDPVDLAEKMKTLYFFEQDKLQEMGNHARSYVAQTFDVNEVVAQYLLQLSN